MHMNPVSRDLLIPKQTLVLRVPGNQIVLLSWKHECLCVTEVIPNIPRGPMHLDQSVKQLKAQPRLKYQDTLLLLEVLTFWHTSIFSTCQISIHLKQRCDIELQLSLPSGASFGFISSDVV